MRTYPCVMSMHAARSAVFVRTGRVLSITSDVTRNFIVLEGITRHRNVLFQLVVHWSGTGLVWMFHSKQTVPTSMCMYLCAMDMFCARTAVFVRTGARVVHHFPCNYYFLSRFWRSLHLVVLKLKYILGQIDTMNKLNIVESLFFVLLFSFFFCLPICRVGFVLVLYTNTCTGTCAWIV